MITSEPTAEMIQEWKQVYEVNHKQLKPNRISGREVDKYFRSKYSPALYYSPEFKKVVEYNIITNEHSREKLPTGVLPQIATYTLDGNTVLVGIDLITGYFHVESENTEKMAAIYDDLFVIRGLDEKDLENFFLVAQYIQCSK